MKLEDFLIETSKFQLAVIGQQTENQQDAELGRSGALQQYQYRTFNAYL